MSRVMLLNPLLVLLAAAGGYGVCVAMGWPAHVKEMVIAAVGFAVASGLALTPLMLHHDRSTAGVAQASLVATMLHLMAGMFFATLVTFALKPHGSFLY